MPILWIISYDAEVFCTKSLPLPRLRSVSLWLLQGFRSNIKAFNSFWISLVQNKRYGSTCIFLHGKIPVSLHHLFKGVFSNAPLTNFSSCCDKIFVQNNLRKSLFWITAGGYIHDDGNTMTTGWGHTVSHSQESDRNGCWYSVPFLLSIQNLSPWDGVAQIQGGFSLLDLTFLETFSQTHSELCFHGDSKSSHVDNED